MPNRKESIYLRLAHKPLFTVLPISIDDFTQADVQEDNQMYYAITSSLPRGIRYMAADCGYDDHKLYNLSITRGI
ncbi:MAG: hypothetical protein JO297_05770 [Nitrososphaeraceae archaeon]|nr:hypothetical protein [Nitrososphaeraceae archaeon]